MQFGRINAEPARLRRVYDVPESGGMKVTIAVGTSDLYQEVERLLADGHAKRFRELLAERVFLGFDGPVTDGNGAPLADTAAIRAEMLQDLKFLGFVRTKFHELLVWRAEGNEGGGSAS